MLCPEVENFPSPKVITTYKQCENLEPIVEILKMNNFYKSVVITCPDEVQTPPLIQQQLLEDSDYYRISNVSLTEFLEPTFLENFVRNGNLYVISTDRNCMIDNCLSITPDGFLTLHVLEYVYQILGLEGIKRPHHFYEIKIDLKNLKNTERIRWSFNKLESFDLHLIWEPNNEDVCPSSIAKYFYDRNIEVSQCSLSVTKKNPTIEEVPTLEDVEIDEMTEWVGMLSHEADVNPKETYISTYCQPDSENALKTNRISVLVIKGLFSPKVLVNLCKNLSEYTCSRELDNYWTCLSIQSHGDCLWQWKPSSPKMFQSHDSSCNIFLSKSSHKLYTVGQLKYS